VSRAVAGGLTEGPNRVDSHELVLVGAGAAIKAEQDEQEGDTNELGGRILLVDPVLTASGQFPLVPEYGQKRRGTGTGWDCRV
jgi:hypothetical protein